MMLWRMKILIDSNLDQLRAITERLKGMAMDTRQNQQIDKIMKKVFLLPCLPY